MVCNLAKNHFRPKKKFWIMLQIAICAVGVAIQVIVHCIVFGYVGIPIPNYLCLTPFGIVLVLVLLRLTPPETIELNHPYRSDNDYWIDSTYTLNGILQILLPIIWILSTVIFLFGISMGRCWNGPKGLNPNAQVFVVERGKIVGEANGLDLFWPIGQRIVVLDNGWGGYYGYCISLAEIVECSEAELGVRCNFFVTPILPLDLERVRKNYDGWNRLRDIATDCISKSVQKSFVETGFTLEKGNVNSPMEAICSIKQDEGFLFKQKIFRSKTEILLDQMLLENGLRRISTVGYESYGSYYDRNWPSCHPYLGIKE